MDKTAFRKTVNYYNLPYGELKLSGCKVILKSSRYAWARLNEEITGLFNALLSCAGHGIKPQNKTGEGLKEGIS